MIERMIGHASTSWLKLTIDAELPVCPRFPDGLRYNRPFVKYAEPKDRAYLEWCAEHYREKGITCTITEETR